MTISDEITKLNTNLNDSYTAVSNKGGTLPVSENFDNLPNAINSITELKGETKTVNPTTSQQTITPSSGKNGITQVTVNAVTSAIDNNITAGNIKSGVSILGVNGTVTELKGETRSVSITSASGNTFSPSSGKNGITSITVTPTNEARTVTPTTSQQTLSVNSGYSGNGTITVNAVTSSIDSDIKASNIKSGVNILGVNGTVTELAGETRTVSLTSASSSGQTFTPSSGKNGITSITVKANNQARTVTPSTSSQSLTVNSGYSGNGTITVNAVTSAIDQNISASNIKNGVSILGVTGNYTGTTPTLTTKNITQNGTYNASSDNADGYSSVTVNVSGGGNRKIAPYNCTIEYFDDLPFKKDNNEPYGTDSLPRWGSFDFTTSNMIPVYKTNTGTYNNAYLNPSFSNQNPNYICDFNDGSYINANSIIKFYSNPDDCPAVLNFGALTTVVFTTACQNAINLEKVLFPNVTSLSIKLSFYGCTNLSVIDMPMVNTLPSQALAGSSRKGVFQGTAIQTLSFPALNSTSFGSYTNQFNNMLKGVTGCTVHFPSNLQSVIGNWSSVTSGFGGTNTTVLFDLPATT